MDGRNRDGAVAFPSTPAAPEEGASGDAVAFAEPEARVGQVLRGKYRIERVLGVGGMASVYVATHRNRQSFAIKMLHPQLSVSLPVRARFLGEGYRANSVKHAGVVKVLDDDVAEDGSAFLVMELLEGEGLDRIVERHGSRLPLRAVLAIGHQLLDVLAAAHAAGVVHRDIKPANLFLTRDGTVKVLDFGIARLDATAGQLTSVGALMGTPGFMAPEQARGQSSEIDGRTDVWAAGATLFSLLTGVPVHDGETSQMVMLAAATQPAPSLGLLLPDAPAAVVALVDRALAFDKAARWETAALMRDAVREAYLQAFGEEISPAPLLALLGPTAEGTPAAPALARTAELSGGPVTPPVSRTAILTGETSPAVAAPSVARHPTSLTPPPRPAGRSRRASVVLALAAVATVGAVAAWLSFRAPGPRSADLPSPPTAAIPAAVPPAPPPVAAPVPEPARQVAPAIEPAAPTAAERVPRTMSAHKAGHRHHAASSQERSPQEADVPASNPLAMPLQ